MGGSLSEVSSRAGDDVVAVQHGSDLIIQSAS